MGEAAQRLMTVEEFLDFEGEGDTRYQLVNGVVLAMAPTSDAHGTIVVNVAFEINLRLANRPPCRAVAEAGIRINDYNHYKADVATTCAEPDGSLYLREPVLIVEVLSPTTAGDDFGLKVPSYMALPSVREIWLVDSRKRWAQVWRRYGEEGWSVTLPLQGSATFESEVLGDTVALDRLYRNSGL